MSVQKLKGFLDAQGVHYLTITHSPAFTAQEVAASAHITGRELAKTVLVKVDRKMAMAVVPATQRVDLNLLRQITGAHDVQLAHEHEFSGIFPDCELGAMPPFGNLYGLPVYVDPTLSEQGVIAFNAGTHTELIEMSYADFERLVRPHVLAGV